MRQRIFVRIKTKGISDYTSEAKAADDGENTCRPMGLLKPVAHLIDGLGRMRWLRDPPFSLWNAPVWANRIDPSRSKSALTSIVAFKMMFLQPMTSGAGGTGPFETSEAAGAGQVAKKLIA